MNSRKTMIHFFTIADFEEEEVWLREQHQKGWKLAKTVLPCFYIFNRCTPEDVVYRLDYKNNTETGDYFQLFKDFGWEYFNRFFGWLYFRKPASEISSEQDGEIFSDDRSRIDMIDQIVKTRMLPLLLIFACCLVPNFIMSTRIDDPIAKVLVVVFAVLFALYSYLLTYCGLKLRKLKRQYGINSV